MKFLHTADWHVGKPLRHLKRDAEHVAALAEVLDIARREQVDCLLVAGDIFDSALPPPEAERIVFDFFRELAGARIPAVVIGGNHDHPRRLNAFARLLELVNIRLLGEPVQAGEGGVAEIASQDGSETAVIAALPWVSERKVRDFESLSAEGRHREDYAEGVSRMIEHLCKEFRPDAVNVLLAHVMVDGALTGGEDAGERPLHIGDAYGVRPQRFPADAQYIALGHLHRAQAILPGRAFYAGSPLQLDFGEAGQRKSVCIIDASPGRPAHPETIALTSGRQLRDLGQRGAGVTLDELRALADSVGDAYLRVFVRVDAPSPGLAELVREILPNAVAISLETPDAATRRDPGLMKLSPAELFATFYRRNHTAEPPEPVIDLFNRLHEEVTREAG